MRKNVTIGFSEDEILRLHGAAAMARMPLATYLRWLIQGGAEDRSGRTLSAILERLDEVVTAIANLSSPTESQQPAARPQLPLSESRELFATKMKERGIPSSTIRQVMITLEQLERSPWPEDTTR
jgi:hypothetical protein